MQGKFWACILFSEIFLFKLFLLSHGFNFIHFKDLKMFLDGAKDGAILFSLGSNAKSVYLSQETIKTLLNVFGKLKQRIVMKWESDTLENKPDNVFIGKWLPQDDILAHPKIKLFISHCGFGGIAEAKHHGVPIIGLPLFGDQASNAASVEQEGWGVKLDIATMTEVSLKSSIEEVLTNPK
jgi:glucuronosyltransferase